MSCRRILFYNKQEADLTGKGISLNAATKACGPRMGRCILAARLAGCESGAARNLSARRAAAGLSHRCAAPALRAGLDSRLLADRRHLRRANTGRLSRLLRAGAGACGALGALPPGRRVALPSGRRRQGCAGRLVHHSGAGVAEQPQSCFFHLRPDGFPAGLLKRPGGHPPDRPQPAGNGTGVPRAVPARAAQHLCAAGAALFSLRHQRSAGALLEVWHGGGGHRPIQRYHWRTALHRQGLF